MRRGEVRGTRRFIHLAQVARRFFRHLVYISATVPHLMGRFPRKCNVCTYSGKFFAFGSPPRFDAMCPSCGSLERQRLLKLWVDREVDTLQGGRMLHFAPEVALVDCFRSLSKSYVSADIRPRRADLVVDIEDMELPSESFDLVVCVHVVEHVDDRRALDEMHRVLAPGGVALIMTPVVEGWETTFEDESIVSDREKTLRYGQADHRRFYGRDIRQRFADAGFHVDEFVATEPDVSTYGLHRGDTLFICRKKSQPVVVRLPDRAVAVYDVDLPKERRALPAE